VGELDNAISEATERARESKLNSLVAVMVALVATFMALCNIKDGNVGQAMAQAQSKTVDAWSYYQAKSVKESLAEAGRDQLKAFRLTLTTQTAERDALDRQIADYQKQADRYEKEKADIKREAEGDQRQYDELNIHDDQFDLSEASFSVVIALLGVTALTQKRWLLGVVAVFLVIGFVFGIAGFFEWSLHPNAVMSWLS
jgi:predicted RND superfamily exporter protein